MLTEKDPLPESAKPKWMKEREKRKSRKKDPALIFDCIMLYQQKLTQRWSDISNFSRISRKKLTWAKYLK